MSPVVLCFIGRTRNVQHHSVLIARRRPLWQAGGGGWTSEHNRRKLRDIRGLQIYSPGPLNKTPYTKCRKCVGISTFWNVGGLVGFPSSLGMGLGMDGTSSQKILDLCRWKWCILVHFTHFTHVYDFKKTQFIVPQHILKNDGKTLILMKCSVFTSS